jgi:hypothetical protein
LIKWHVPSRSNPHPQWSQNFHWANLNILLYNCPPHLSSFRPKDAAAGICVLLTLNSHPHFPCVLFKVARMGTSSNSDLPCSYGKYLTSPLWNEISKNDHRKISGETSNVFDMIGITREDQVQGSSCWSHCSSEFPHGTYHTVSDPVQEKQQGNK